VLILLLLLTAVGLAHPFGTDLYGHRMVVSLDRDGVDVQYLAEVSTIDHLRDMRAFLKGVDRPTAADEARYVERVLDELQTGIVVVADGERVAMERLPVDEPSGRGDTRFTNFRLALHGELPADARTLNVANGNLPGYRAIFNTELLVGDAVVIDDCSLYHLQGGELRSDQAGRWLSEEDGRELRVSFHLRSAAGAAAKTAFRRLVAGGQVEPLTSASKAPEGASEDPLLELVRGEVTPLTVVIGLLTAVVLGALHGLSPGHGKALVAAYLVGSRRSVWQAVWLGVIVTATHTISVYAMGAVAWILAESFSPEKVLPWLELASGLLIVGVGAGLLRSRWRAARATGDEHGQAHAHDHGHAHAHAHAHAHGHGHGHTHGGDAAAHGAAHAAEFAQAGEAGVRGLVALGVSGGLAPCPSAMVLLLTAIGLQRIGLGLVLVFAFSLGLALLVSGLGIAVLLLGDRVMAMRRGAGAARVLPVLSAVIVTLLGVVLSARGVLSVAAALSQG